MDADFLLTRGPDLVVLGVRLHEFTPGPAASGAGQPVMVAASDGARIVLVFPPQHVVEQTFSDVPAADAVAQGLLAGSTRVAYAIAAGTAVRLDAAGVLAACVHVAPDPRQPGSPAPVTGPPGPLETAIELPSRVVSTPSATSQPSSTQSTVESQHPSDAVFGPGGAIGAWLTRLRPSGAAGTSGPGADSLTLHLIDPGLLAQPDRILPIALDQDARTTIAAAAATRSPQATRLQLSSLGGSLTALGDWDGFRWSHRTAVSRDQEVVVQERGVLYPFGLRAVLTEVSVRDPAGSVDAGSLQTPGAAAPPPVAPVPPGGTLGLRKLTTLQLVDTIRSAQDAGVISRTFPFHAVEVTSSRFTGLGSLEVGRPFTRPTPALNGLLEQLAADQASSLQDEAVWRPAADGLTRTFDDLVNAGFPPALTVAADGASLTPDGSTLTQINADIAELQELDQANANAVDALTQAQTALDDLLSTTATTQDGSVDPNIAEAQQAVSDAALEVAAHPFSSVEADNLRRLIALAGVIQPQIDAAQQQCDVAMSQPRTVEDVARDTNAPDQAAAASAWIELQPTIAADQQAVDLEAAQSTPFHIFGWPTTTDGTRLRFPARLRRDDQVIDVTIPMIFVKDFVLDADGDTPAYASLDDPGLADALDDAWRGSDAQAVARGLVFTEAALPPPAGVVTVPGVLLDVVGAATPAVADVHVVQALHILGPAGPATSGRSVAPADLFTPSLGRAAANGAAAVWAMNVDLPAVRTLTGAGADALGAAGVQVSFAQDFLTNGPSATLLFDTVSTLAVDFTTQADRSGGLTALQLQATGIARALGPVQVNGLTGDAASVIGEAATLFGLPLKNLLQTVPGPPAIVSTLIDGAQPVVEMTWANVVPKDFLFFKAHRGTDTGRPSRLDLTVRSVLDDVSTTCTLTDFSLLFPPEGTALIRLDFSSVNFLQHTSHEMVQAPTMKISGFDVTLLGPLELLQELQKYASLVDSVPGVHATPSGVTATFVLPVPDLACGAFSLSNIVFRSVVDVPFGGDPVSVNVGFASRDNPFGVSVLTFGGTGYVDIRIDANGPRIEASMDFGARMAVNFLVAKGEVHALGGVRYLQRGTTVTLTGFVRIGGSVEILGLISASIELVIELAYDTDTKTLAGRATLVLEIDLTLWSDSVEIDSGLWVLAGGVSSAQESLPAGAQLMSDDEIFALIDAPPTEADRASWRAYRSRYVRGGVA